MNMTLLIIYFTIFIFQSILFYRVLKSILKKNAEEKQNIQNEFNDKLGSFIKDFEQKKQKLEREYLDKTHLKSTQNLEHSVQLNKNWLGVLSHLSSENPTLYLFNSSNEFTLDSQEELIKIVDQLRQKNVAFKILVQENQTKIATGDPLFVYPKQHQYPLKFPAYFFNSN